VASFTLAINSNRSRQEGDSKDDVSYIDLVAFGKQADLVKNYLEKGAPLLVEGRLQQRRWEQEGQKRSKVEVVVQSITFMGGSKKSTQSGAASFPQDEDQGFGGYSSNESDVPF
jgi:single-strand DNA-binding protein